MAAPAATVSSRAQLKALLTLSHFRKSMTASRLDTVARTAPDPETAIRKVLGELADTSPALERQWRKTVTALWAQHHPEVPALPDLPLTKKDAIATFQLLDALAVVNALTHHPARLVPHGHHTHIHPQDHARLARVLESGDRAGLERLRAVLEAVHLIRPYRGQLQVVRSRLKRFLTLPRSYQFYALWHADVYHVAWADFAHDWQEYVSSVQDYLPLLWESAGHSSPDTTIDKHDWCLGVMETFVPIWTQQGVLTPSQGRWSLLSLFHQCTLPVVLNQLLINDLFARYGLIQFEPDGNFVWTTLGTTLMAAERDHSIPCGLELF